VRQATRAPASPASVGPVFVVVAWMTSDRGAGANVHGCVATDDPRPSARVVMSSQISFCGFAYDGFAGGGDTDPDAGPDADPGAEAGPDADAGPGATAGTFGDGADGGTGGCRCS
jgi:hypothetical protein